MLAPTPIWEIRRRRELAAKRAAMVARPQEPAKPTGPPVTLKGMITRRGKLILNDGRAFAATFGRPFKSLGGDRTRVSVTIDDHRYTGFMTDPSAVNVKLNDAWSR